MAFSEICRNGLALEISDKIPVVHAFTTRFGGVSGGYLDSLNLGENRGDSEENVRNNYGRLFAALGVSKNAVHARQVHGNDVRVVSSADARDVFTPYPWEADGIVTNEPELPLMVFTADCTPILLCDGKAKAVGAVHSGWRGTAQNIVGEAVRKMCREFGSKPENITAAIGPCISRCCFETGAEVRDAMMKLPINAEAAVTPRGDKFMTDLKLINKLLLMEAGVPKANIDVSEECTFCSHDKYWSHRYTGGERGSQAAIIMLKGR